MRLRGLITLCAMAIAGSLTLTTTGTAQADVSELPALSPRVSTLAHDTTNAPDAAHKLCAATVETNLADVRCFRTQADVATARAAATVYGEVMFNKTYGAGTFYVWARQPCNTLSGGPVQDVNLATWDNNTAANGVMTGGYSCNRWMGWSLPGCSGRSLGWGYPGVLADVGWNSLMCVRFWRV